jgi:hypothetical protein
MYGVRVCSPDRPHHLGLSQVATPLLSAITVDIKELPCGALSFQLKKEWTATFRQ